MGKKLIFGVGVNDANYQVTITKEVCGKRKIVWRCPFYSKWYGMVSRCYSEKELSRHPTYIGCSVSQEWLTFSNFRDWMALQDWSGKDLDKDILVVGNKIYSPENCLFVNHAINSFICEPSRGNLPAGVSLITKSKKFAASILYPIFREKRHLGCFDTAEDAHKAWRAAKKEYAIELASTQEDKRVSVALKARYA